VDFVEHASSLRNPLIQPQGVDMSSFTERRTPRAERSQVMR